MTEAPRNPEPRFGTPRNHARKTRGRAVGKVMKALNNDPMPWQQHVLDVACEIDPVTGLYWYKTIILIGLRQIGKTSISRGKLTHRALSTRNARMIYTAQNRLKALKRLHEDFHEPIMDSPLKQFMGKPHWTTGSESLRWATGSKLGIDAVGKNSGHGDTNHEAHIDEAYAHVDGEIEQGISPTMITVKGSQKWILSAAGTSASTYLAPKVEMGQALVESKRDSRVAYFEYSASRDEDPNDPETVLKCHPAVGHTISLADVMAERDSMTEPGEFERAYLGWWPEAKAAPRVIPTAAWESCYLPAEAEAWTGMPFWTIDTSPDREWTSIGMAAKATDPDAACYLEVYERLVGTAGVVSTLVQLRDTMGGNTVAVDGNGAAKSLIRDLEDEGFDVIKVSGPSRVDACGGLHDDALAGKLRFENDPVLNDAMANAIKQYVGGRAWIFARNKTLADISALYAVAFARWLFKEKAGDDYDIGDSLG